MIAVVFKDCGVELAANHLTDGSQGMRLVWFVVLWQFSLESFFDEIFNKSWVDDIVTINILLSSFKVFVILVAEHFELFLVLYFMHHGLFIKFVNISDSDLPIFVLYRIFPCKWNPFKFESVGYVRKKIFALQLSKNPHQFCVFIITYFVSVHPKSANKGSRIGHCVKGLKTAEIVRYHEVSFAFGEEGNIG